MTHPSVDSLGSPGTTPLSVEFYGLDDLTGPVMDELAILYPKAYHNSKMLSDLEKDIAREPEVFMFTVARENFSSSTDGDDIEPGHIIGARLIRDAPPDDTEEHFGYPAVHGSRFCVDPEARGFGIGSLILSAGNQHCFDNLGVPVVFGSSNEAGAMRMYAKNGAMFYKPSIEAYGSDRNSPAVNVAFFEALIAKNRPVPGYRMTGGPHIRYAYARDLEVAEHLEELGFYTPEGIVATEGITRFRREKVQQEITTFLQGQGPLRSQLDELLAATPDNENPVLTPENLTNKERGLLVEYYKSFPDITPEDVLGDFISHKSAHVRYVLKQLEDGGRRAFLARAK